MDKIIVIIMASLFLAGCWELKAGEEIEKVVKEENKVFNKSASDAYSIKCDISKK